MKKFIKKHACAIFWITIFIYLILWLILGWETFKLILLVSGGLLWGYTFNHALHNDSGYHPLL